jgi:ribonuclease HI
MFCQADVRPTIRNPMPATSPHYLLFSQAASQEAGRDHWQFLLQSADGPQYLEAADAEPDAPRSRLELLAVVRGLEALDQPSRVTLVTRSRYVSRGIRHGLSQWRERHWQWECFGRLVPVRDHDLWQRVDRALAIHAVECCPWQWDAAPAAADVADEIPAAAVAAEAVASESPINEQSLEPAVLIVRRPKWNDWQAEPHRGIGRRLAQWVHALRAAVGRPTFTRAA